MARFFSMIAVLVAVCILCSADALAKGGKGGKKGGSTCEQLDKDKDDKVTLEEFKAGAKDADRAAKQFSKADKNGDKSLSKDEFKAMEEARKERGKKKK